MSKVYIEMVDEGVRELLHVVGEEFCGPLAQSAAQTCGEGYGADVFDVGNRNVASVYASTYEAYKDTIRNNTILRALGDGG